MLISACPVNAAVRMLDTNFYVAVSSVQAGGIYKIDVTTALATAADGEHVTYTSTTLSS